MMSVGSGSFEGVYANPNFLEKCRDELEDVLDEWAGGSWGRLITILFGKVLDLVFGTPDPIACRVVALREEGSRLWSFYLINDGANPLKRAVLDQVAYEWGDQYMDTKSPSVSVTNLPAGERALIWQDDGGSEMRTDLWLRINHGWRSQRLLFSFPKLYRQDGRELIGRMSVE